MSTGGWAATQASAPETGRDSRFAAARRLIQDANRAGLRLCLAGDDLRYEGEIASVSDAIRSRLRDLTNDVVAELSRPRFGLENRSTAAVTLPEYWVGWWSEMNVNTLLANGTHVVWRLRGALCADRFRAALAAVVPQHPLLQARIVEDERVLQIEFGQEWALVSASVADCQSGNQSGVADRAQRLAGEILWAPMRDGQVFRPFLVEISGTEVICGFVLHHLVADFYACHLLARELCRHLFPAIQTGIEPGGRWLEYSDYVHARAQWEEGLAGQYRLGYWSRYLDRAPAVRLPGAVESSTQYVARLQTIEFAIDQDLRTRLTHVTTAFATTLAQVLLAAKFVTLAALLRQTDLLVTVIVSGRDDPALLRFIGNTADCLPMRLEVQPSQSFPGFLEQLRAAYTLGCRYRVKWELVLKALAIPAAAIVAPTFNFVSAGRAQREQRDNECARGQLPMETVRLARPLEHGSAIRHKSYEMNMFDTGCNIRGYIKYMPWQQDAATVKKFIQCFGKCLLRIVECPTLPIVELI